MAKRYWFSCEDFDLEENDYIGNIRGAKSLALNLAKKYKTDIYINLSDDIVDCVSYDD